MTKPRVTRLILTAVAVAVLGLGAACGGKASSSNGSSAQGGGSTDSAQALDPCGLVSTDQISTIVGETATQQGAAAGENRGRICHWNIADGLVAIATFHGQQFYQAGTIGSPVTGVGDEAQATTGGTVLFRKGEEVVSVQVLGGASSHDQAIALAKAAADAI